MDNQREIIEEFLIESNESLAQLDQDFITLEKQPDNQDLLSSIFRAIHTIKGVSGFLGFATLGAVTHRAETILSQLRDGDRPLTPELTDLLLETFDVVKKILAEIERTSEEGADDYKELVDRLEQIGKEQKSKSSNTTSAVIQPLVIAVDHQLDHERLTPTSIADSNIRVSVEALDNLMDLVGELVLARNQILQFTTTKEDAEFVATAQRLNLITTELQAKVMRARMQPIRVVWDKFPRVVRDMGRAFGKQIELVIAGENTELDKTVIEAIKDPLTHIVRNSCDHGIESTEARVAAGKPAKGRLWLQAFHEGGSVNIEISDDGGGINAERVKEVALAKGLITAERLERSSEAELVNLVFEPGFSTAETVTSVSGRGVGMDVVRTCIEKIGGSIDLQSKRGQGTTIKIKIPLTLAIIPALVVASSNERFAIPQVNLLELLCVEQRQIESIHGAFVYRLRDRLLPLIYLHEALGLMVLAQRKDQPINIVVLQADERIFGLVVDSIQDTAEIVVKPLNKLLRGLSFYAGATVMGDGSVALILDVRGLADAGNVFSAGSSLAQPLSESQAESHEDLQKTLLFHCGNHRFAVPLALVDRLEEFPADRIEMAGPRRVVQYRGRILPIIQLADHVASVAELLPSSVETIQVIVFSEGTLRFGVQVEAIVDIVEEAISIRARIESPGLLGSAVVDGQVTDLIDVRYLISRVREEASSCSSVEGFRKRVLVVDASPFARGLLREDLEMAGHQVVEAVDANDALERLTRNPVDIVISNVDLPESGSQNLLTQLHQTTEFAGIPTLGLIDDSSPARETPAFDELRNKDDREAVLNSIARLAGSIVEPETVEV